MTRATIEAEFRALRASSGLSLRDIGAKCSLSETTPWKIENGRSVRWETVHLILTVALKRQPGSPDYENIHRLWLDQRQRRAESFTPQHAKQKLPAHAAKAVYDFRELLKGKSEAKVAKIFQAAQRAEKRL